MSGPPAMTPEQRDVERAGEWLYEQTGRDEKGYEYELHVTSKDVAEFVATVRAEATREVIETAGVAELLAVTRGWIEINERQFSMVPPMPESKAYQFAMARIARTHEAIDRVERALAAAPAAREEG